MLLIHVSKMGPSFTAYAYHISGKSAAQRSWHIAHLKFDFSHVEFIFREHECAFSTISQLGNGAHSKKV